MIVRTFYDSIGENYDEVFDRIGNDKWIEKYLRKFITEDYFAALEELIIKSEWEEAFKAAHSLKGLALNLGLSQLAASSSKLCETVRHGAPTEDISSYVACVAADYSAATSKIRELAD